ncbi:hypothetical protein VNO77_20369 [Canavalia gladiata]|uniref:Uncharacterized protein n=1 Tax=Canavalia gladiata TaxID=3824 RepID=A0AAN9LT22_CANGL
MTTVLLLPKNGLEENVEAMLDEIEFDAMEEPPSRIDVEAFYFDGSFDQDVSLGHVEINFLKHTSPELADMS